MEPASKLSGLSGRLRSGVIGNVLVQGASQLLQTGIQLGMVPILIHAWGVERYGTWILLFTIPGYLSIADFGISRVSANLMAAAMSRGDTPGVVAAYQVLRLTTALLFAGLLAILFVAVTLVRPSILDFAQASTGGRAVTAAMLLVAYGLSNFLTGTVYAGFRAIDRYIQCGWAVLAIWTIEAVAAATLALSGFGIVTVAASYFLIHTVGFLILVDQLRRRAPWLTTWRPAFARRHFADMFRPAVASVTLPAANAITMQGSVAAVGAGMGVAAVPIFSTARTVTRLPVQLSLMLSAAAMPSITVADAKGDTERTAMLFASVVMISIVLLLPGFVAVALLGPTIVRIWTGGAIQPSHMFMAILACAMIPSALWQITANFLAAVNRYALYGYFYLAASAIAVFATSMLARHHSLSLAVVPLVVLECVMLIRLAIVGSRLGLVRWETFAMGLAQLRARWERPRGRNPAR